ncbi:MAG: SUMF1/EgtB/PvdO family nonheme iron enzyme [Planctomycetota bacterium]
MRGQPDGARAYLFRYHESTGSGPARQVPVPFPFTEPTAATGMQAGDLVLAVERVMPDGLAARAGMQAGDLVLAVAGQPPTEEVLDRPLLASGLELRVWSAGAMRNVTLRGDGAPGIEAMATIYPLACSPSNLLGTLPACRVAVEPGSYLILVRSDRHEDLRLPVHVQRAGERLTLRADLHPAGMSPPGFVFVAAGEFTAGGGGTSRPEQNRWLDGYWIARNELSTRDYLEFLQDSETGAEIERCRKNWKLLLVPRKRCQIPEIHRPLWTLRPDGKYEPDRELHLPITAISCADCEAYCRWLSARAKRQNEPWLFRLPTEDEWEKAARGVDARAFPWGAQFDPNLCWMTNPLPATRPRGEPLRPRPLGDESPFGVRDMAGGVLEWCLGDYLGTPMRPWRSGAWGNTDSAFSRPAARNGGFPWRVDEKDGFRLVAVRRER